MNHQSAKKYVSKKYVLSAAAAWLLAACSPAEQAAAPADTSAAAGNKKIAITAIVEHPALDAVRKGVLDELKNKGYEAGKNLTVDFQSAQGSTANAAQIAKKFAGSNPDVIVAVSTPSAQSMAAATKTIPVVYAGVTDPVAAKLVPGWEASNTNVTGVSDELPLEPQIDLMKKLVPAVKNVGYVYSPGEVNSTTVLAQLKAKLPSQGINVVEAPAQRSADVLAAARSLNGKVDLLYTSPDNNVVASYESMYKAAVEMKKPLVASNTDSVKRGAAAALGVNYYDLGRKAGDMVFQILNGKKAGEIPSARMETLDLFLNKKNAAATGAVLPEDLLGQAKEVQE
ncbi:MULTISPECIES: ABC transporter substrate-binding protein [Neisseria]|uniref:ABC transporter substrate binding family protein n=1 Tax=Neisseria musculi TaxID=1815583 RepID=A0A7H1M9V1_9NEIS|nr:MULTISPECIES: ABC transporter substrate-binding protein [Neisseria]MBF0804382.1 ABC transporter substrate-binding protein [Neisseria sp. 19428wB4_WF04]QNT58416.1 ABC transporter substrate binding family protein [Neisseria musculi]TFU42862.1 ABC transporter substrate-binding protein [Neisseria sp. WF04]